MIMIIFGVRRQRQKREQRGADADGAPGPRRADPAARHRAEVADRTPEGIRIRVDAQRSRAGHEQRIGAGEQKAGQRVPLLFFFFF